MSKNTESIIKKISELQDNIRFYLESRHFEKLSMELLKSKKFLSKYSFIFWNLTTLSQDWKEVIENIQCERQIVLITVNQNINNRNDKLEVIRQEFMSLLEKVTSRKNSATKYEISDFLQKISLLGSRLKKIDFENPFIKCKPRSNGAILGWILNQGFKGKAISFPIDINRLKSSKTNSGELSINLKLEPGKHQFWNGELIQTAKGSVILILEMNILKTEYMDIFIKKIDKKGKCDEERAFLHT